MVLDLLCRLHWHFSDLRIALNVLCVLKEIPLTKQQINEVHQLIDKHHTGVIRYDDFLDAFKIVDVWAGPPKKKKKDKSKHSKKHHNHHQWL